MSMKFTPLEKIINLNRWSLSFKAGAGIKPLSSQTARGRNSLTGFTNKKMFVLMVVLFFLFYPNLSVFAASEVPYTNFFKRISMDFKDASLKDVLKIFSQQAGLNFVASQDIEDANLTLYFDNVTVKQALDNLLSANKLVYELEPRSNIFVVKRSTEPAVKTITKVFYLKFARLPDSKLDNEIKETMTDGGGEAQSEGGKDKTGILQTLKGLLSEYGRMDSDPNMNAIIITDIPEKFTVFESVLARLDVPVPQIMIEVEVLDVSKSATEKLGFEIDATPVGLDMSNASRDTSFPFGEDKVRAATNNNFGQSSFSLFNTDHLLNFFKSRTDTKFLARPRLLTLNNETAEIKIATDESIGVKVTAETSSSGAGTTTEEAERTPTGVVFRVTPQANLETNEITMLVYPRVSESRAGNEIIKNGQTFQFRDPEERSTKSIIRIKDNQTLMIGGLIRNRNNEVNKKTPILGDIPLVGLLFRNKDISEDSERELIVFVTPRIIRDTDTEQPFELVGPALDLEREQDAFGRDLEIETLLKKYEIK